MPRGAETASPSGSGDLTAEFTLAAPTVQPDDVPFRQAGQLQEFVRTYRRVWAESGHKSGAEQIQVAQFCYVAEKRADAQAGFERICRRYLETFADAVVSWQGKTSDQYPGYEKMVASILATTPEKIGAAGRRLRRRARRRV